MLTRRRFVMAAVVAPIAGVVRAADTGGAGLAGIVPPGAQVAEAFAGGKWCEGPAWDRRRGVLVFSDVRADRILTLAGDGTAATLRDPSNYANGNAFDREGRLVSCEHLGRRVARQERDGRITVLADRHLGRPLNSPNDVVVARDGSIWFTDPTFGLQQPEEGRMADSEQAGRFVFRIAPDGALAVAADGFEQPNGLAFSPDERVLYVSDTSGASRPEGKREVRAFDVRDGRLSNERLFATVPSGVPDGLKTDERGRLYGATDRGATVWDVDGTLLGHIATPATCGNLAFGGPDGRRLYLCNGSAIHRIDLHTRGAHHA